MRKLARMLRLENISKRYGDDSVFSGLNHTFQPGCYALCEEERSGKSTLLGLIAGAIPLDGGDIVIRGVSLRQHASLARALTAYVPENGLQTPSQTGREYLEQEARLKGDTLDAELLDLADALGLEPHLDKRFDQMSTGTRRKVHLVAAALGDPAVIVADGPTDGLDAGSRALVAELFQEWARTKVVLFASHDAQLVDACEAHLVKLELR